MNQPVIGRRVAQAPKAVATIGQVAHAIGQVPAANTAAIAAEIVRFVAEADKALDQATRAVVNTPEAAGKVADLLKAIRAEANRQDAARKAITAPLDEFKTKLTSLYRIALGTLTDATDILKDKASAYVKAEQARRDAEAAAQAKAAAAEAERLAKAQAALGDAKGAQQILDDAALLPAAAAKVTATGGYGATLGTRVTKKGTVVANRQFLYDLLQRADKNDAVAKEFIDDLSFPQGRLNDLARAVIDAAYAPIAGFKAEEVSDISSR
jgi:hypothetical protein